MPEGIVIATPHAHGICWPAYKRSCVDLENMLTRAGLSHLWLDNYNESLITRGRDMFAREFMASGFSVLLFVDNDIEFKGEDVARLWDLEADIAAGCYRRKKSGEPYVVAVNNRLQTEEDLDSKNGPFLCDYAGTGFMMIRREVFLQLQTKFPEWHYKGLDTAGQKVSLWSYFQDPLEQIGDQVIKLSEDQFFCYRAREVGVEIVAHPHVRLAHWGQSRFNGAN